MGELAGTDLVRDLPGLGIAPVVALRRLQLRELLEGTARERGLDDRVLQARDQRVAAEERDVPRHAGRRDPEVGAEVVVVQTERAHIVHRSAIDAVDVLVGARHLGRTAEPAVLEHVLRSDAVVLAAASRRAHRFAAIEQVMTAGVPRGAGGEVELEGDPAVGVTGRRAAVQQPVDETPAEVAVGVRGLELRTPRMPPRDDAPAPDGVPHVGEGSDVCGRIALEGDEIGGTSDGDPPRARLGGEASGRGCGQRGQDIGK